MATMIAEIKVNPLSDALGAEIIGVDLSKPLDAATAKAVEDAWHEHIVLVFRDQEMSNEDQVRFCSHYGELEEVRTGNYAKEDMKHTMLISNVTDTGLMTALENGDMWFHAITNTRARRRRSMRLRYRRLAAIRCSPIVIRRGRPCRRNCAKSSTG